MKNALEEMSKKFYEDVTKHLQEHMDFIFSAMTVDDWMDIGNIPETTQLLYPNAKTAAEIKASPLAKALE